MTFKLILSSLACAIVISVFASLGFARAPESPTLVASDVTVANRSAVVVRVKIFELPAAGCQTATYTRDIAPGSTKRLGCKFDPAIISGEPRCMVQIIDTETNDRICSSLERACGRRAINAVNRTRIELEDAPNTITGIDCDVSQ